MSALPPTFVDVINVKNGDPAPTPSMINTRIAIERLGLKCRYDVFHDRYTVNGSAFGNSAVQVSDAAARQLREMIRLQFKFDPGVSNAMDALYRACEANAFHPVLDYLDGLTWDGTPRIDRWLSTYMRADDNEFTRGVSRLILIAAVRRIRLPGTKFDCMLVLESPEGYGKSSALAELFGRSVFTDQTILGVSDKELQEVLRGRWCVEVPELVGLRRSDIERVKSAITRETDRARPAYGRATVEVPRSMVLIGTTNDEEYLRALSGENRRFLPIAVGRVDLPALIRDRDQLWAEACDQEEWTTPSLSLPEELWQHAADARVDRTQDDPWADVLDRVAEHAAQSQADCAEMAEDPPKDGKPPPVITIYDASGVDAVGKPQERVSSAYVLDVMLGIPADKRTPEMQKRAGRVMRSLGWSKPKGGTARINGVTVRAYVRTIFDPWD
jgi:predicted P-loop ATPase